MRAAAAATMDERDARTAEKARVESVASQAAAVGVQIDKKPIGISKDELATLLAEGGGKDRALVGLKLHKNCKRRVVDPDHGWVDVTVAVLGAHPRVSTKDSCVEV